MSVNFNTQCEAISRKTNERCPHKCCTQIPSTLAGHFVMDKKFFLVNGRPVHLCSGHSHSFWQRCKRLLTVKLIGGGYLSPYNRYGYGSIVTTSERIDFATVPRLVIPEVWGPVKWRGRVPPRIAEALGITFNPGDTNRARTTAGDQRPTAHGARRQEQGRDPGRRGDVGPADGLRSRLSGLRVLRSSSGESP